jgi:hypothetical protein
VASFVSSFGTVLQLLHAIESDDVAVAGGGDVDVCGAGRALDRIHFEADVSG